MKYCRNVNGIIKAVKKHEMAVLPVWDIMINSYNDGGAYLNLGEGRYCYVGKENWNSIRNNIVDASNKNIYLKTVSKYKMFYK